MLHNWRNTIANAGTSASRLHFATRIPGFSPPPLPEYRPTAAGCAVSSFLQPPCGSKPDEYDLSRALKTAVTAWDCPDRGRKVVHSFVVKLGYCRFTILMTALVDLTIKRGRDLGEARKLFDELSARDVVSWTSMVLGYAQRGHYWESLDLFRRMGLRHGREVHAHLLKASAEEGIDPVVQNNLLNMYSRCQDLSRAQKLFGAMPKKDIITWNEMISGYLGCGLGGDALRLFAGMVSSGLKPDRFTYATCVDACGYLASLRQGIQVHAGILKAGFHSDIVVSNALVNMYARCGSIESAKLVFDALSSTDTIVWTTMIAAYAKCGFVMEATSTFEQMLEMGIKPDEITFLAVLSACSHGGLAGEGWHYFRSMTEVHSIPAKLEHYNCMVDMLCRSGLLEDALHFIKQMPCNPSISMRETFLSACRLQGNIGLAQAARQFVEMDSKNHGNLVGLSNAYAAVSNWDETWEIRRKMKEENVKKEPGCSWVEI
ncbi:hypothetical protein Taro_033810 [Colocasia esculenta]|uniref:Pentatricopeptide repeat-containing protein n=1 Tax=Colocasia esculenta TaxID=4460 RepID=A0A843VPP7_COLES|nr:hypothetical protein [Colocasia esculenta]